MGLCRSESYKLKMLPPVLIKLEPRKSRTSCRKEKYGLLIQALIFMSWFSKGLFALHGFHQIISASPVSIFLL